MVSKKGLAARDAEGAGVFGMGFEPGTTPGWGEGAAVVEKSEKAAFGRWVVLRVPNEAAGSGSSSSGERGSVVARSRTSFHTAWKPPETQPSSPVKPSARNLRKRPAMMLLSGANVESES